MEMQPLSARTSNSGTPPSIRFLLPEEDVRMRHPPKVNLVRARTLTTISSADVSLRPKVDNRVKRYDSLIALEEMVECRICSTRQQNPKMLICQHTFCYNCCKVLLSETPGFIGCPTCKQHTTTESVDSLPSNMYLNDVISLLMKDDNAETNKEMPKQTPNNRNTPTKSCAKCNTVCQEQNIIKCQHCKTDFCGVCFPQHADELIARYPDFLKQLEEHKTSLIDEQTAYKRHCNGLVHDIKQGVQKKIEEMKNMEAAILNDVTTLHEAGDMEIVHISEKIVNLQKSLAKENEVKSLNKVGNYMDYHQQMSQILDSISSLAVNYKQFNMATFALDEPPSPGGSDNNFIYDEICNSRANSPSLCSFYKNKVYSPKLISTKFQKPTGVCFSPWDGNQVYVCNVKSIYVYDITLGKVTTRIQDDNMTSAHSIACNANSSELFVSDRSRNVVHVFNKEGAYVRQLMPKNLSNPNGVAVGKDGDLLLCDTGNDRVLIVDSTNGKIKNTVGVVRDVTELSMPTDVASDGKIIVIADVGNHRVKIFDADTLLRRSEIGSLGKQKGQFRSAEVVHVDEGGIILVGDSGNRRIQMFNSQGEFILSTSSEYKFNAISGICTNNKGDVVVTDYKSKSLVKF